jgi:hypothetical protein
LVRGSQALGVIVAPRACEVLAAPPRARGYLTARFSSLAVGFFGRLFGR